MHCRRGRPGQIIVASFVNNRDVFVVVENNRHGVDICRGFALWYPGPSGNDYLAAED